MIAGVGVRVTGAARPDAMVGVVIALLFGVSALGILHDAARSLSAARAT